MINQCISDNLELGSIRHWIGNGVGQPNRVKVKGIKCGLISVGVRIARSVQRRLLIVESFYSQIIIKKCNK